MGGLTCDFAPGGHSYTENIQGIYGFLGAAVTRTSVCRWCPNIEIVFFDKIRSKYLNFDLIWNKKKME